MHIRLWTLSVRLSVVLGASVHISEPGICLYSSSRVTPLYVSVWKMLKAVPHVSEQLTKRKDKHT